MSNVNCFENFPKTISELKNLKSLKMTDNGYNTNLPENISVMSNLETLDLSNNPFTGSIPDSYSKLKNLKTLKLNNSKLKGYIPYSFKDLEKLTELNLSNTELTGYIPDFSNVTVCDYDHTDLCTLSSTKCSNIKKSCSKDDIKKTNNSNGNPDPNNKEYENDIKSSGSFFDNHHGLLVIIYLFGSLIGICVFVWLCICMCSCCGDDDALPTYSSQTNNNENTFFKRSVEQNFQDKQKARMRNY